MSNLLFDHFLKITKELNNRFGIKPLLYGSLGLEILTGVKTYPEDIDVLIPIKFLNDKWYEFMECIESIGYKMDNFREHEFHYKDHKIAFSHIEDLNEFADIRLEDIEERSVDSITFRLLNLHQYYRVYSMSINDGYRINTRKKKDGEKLELICNLIEKHI